MFATDLDGSTAWVFIMGTALLGAALSPAAETLIAGFLPRLGATPRLPARIATAAVTGIACAVFALRFGITWQLPAFIFFAVMGVQLARIDFSLHLLPNPLVAVLLGGSFSLLLMPTLFNQHADNMVRALLGAIILFAGYLILGLISPGAIGMGDVKLAAPVGLYLGYLGWPHLLYGGLMGFVLNGVVTAVTVTQKGRKRPSEVAHGPSMLGATLAVILVFT